MTVVPVVPRNGSERRRKKKKKELQRDKRSPGSNGFANKARGQQVAALDASDSLIGSGRFSARPSDDHEN